MQPLHQLLQPTAPDPRLRIAPHAAARQNVNLAVLLNQFRFNRVTYLASGQRQETLFHLAQLPARRAHQVVLRISANTSSIGMARVIS